MNATPPPNPFNIRENGQTSYILRACPDNWTVYGLAESRTFEIYSDDMRLLGAVHVHCSPERGHEIVTHTLTGPWLEAVDSLEEKHFRSAMANNIAIFKTKRYI